MLKKLLTGLLTVTMLFGQILPVMASDDTDISVSEDVIMEEETGDYTPGEEDDALKNVRRLTYGQIVANPVTINDKVYNLYADVSYYAQVLYTGKKIKPAANLLAETRSTNLESLAMELTGAKDVTGLIKWTYSAKKNKKCSDKAYFTIKASVKGKVARSIGLKGKALKNFKKGLKKINKAAKSVKFRFTITKTLDEEKENENNDDIYEAKPVTISSSTFPDDTFRAIISSRTYDKDGNGVLDEKEINETLNIYCEGKGIKSIKGVEYFVALQGLWCKDNEIETMDLSRNRDLRGIWCSGNKFTSLDFTPNPRLVWVYCFDCNLRSLNVSNNPKMAYIECNTNPLPVLDVTHNPELEHLTCGTCEIEKLDLSKCPMLSHLDAFQNKLTSIDLSNNPKMKRLDIWSNPGLVNVDISSLKDLEFYNCAANGLTQLDVSNNPQLMALYCDWNKIPKLDLSNNPRLADLRCACNSLTELDISKNPQLYYLQIFGNNELKSININNNSRLRYLMKQVEDGNVERVYDPDSQSYDMLLDLGGDHEYMDDMRYFISVARTTEIVMDKPNDSADVNDVYINTNDGLSKDAKIVTRGEAILDLYKQAGSPSVSGSSRFTDVTGTDYENAVIWGEKNHLIFGSPNLISDKFNGSDAVARQDFALMYHRYAELVGYKSAFDYGRTDNFSDFFDMDYYSWGAFTWAIQWEILPKRGDYIYPHGRVTSEEMEAAYKTLLELNK